MSFFLDIFKNHFNKFACSKNRIKYKNKYFIYAVDGDEAPLPLSDKILKAGYRGRALKNHAETHYPRLYLMQKFDVLNGLIAELLVSAKRHEPLGTVKLVAGSEKNSITLYDRNFKKTIIRAHREHGSYFIIRWNHKNKREKAEKLNILVDQIPVRLIYIKNPNYDKDNSNSEEILVFATNLCEKEFSDIEIRNLYSKRWEIETAFRDSTSTLKREQWHSKDMNGILQELYAHCWFYNYSKLIVHSNTIQEQKEENKVTYKKPNFKLICENIILKLECIVKKNWKKVTRFFSRLIERSMEKRERYSRSYPRAFKKALSRYKLNNSVKRRAA